MLNNLNINYLDIFSKEEQDVLNLSIKWHHNIPLETPIELVVETKTTKVGNKEYVEISPMEDATLVINGQDRFTIPYDDFIHLFMPMGYRHSVKSDNKEKLSEMFDYMNTDGMLNILSKIGAYEIVGFDTNNDDNVVTCVKDGKLVKIGIEKSMEMANNGWTYIGDDTYCYSPMSNYIIWGSIDQDNIRIIMY